MWPNPQFPADFVTFTEETLNGKLHFLCIEWIIKIIYEVLNSRLTSVVEWEHVSQTAFTCSKLTIDILEQCVKYVQS